MPKRIALILLFLTACGSPDDVVFGASQRPTQYKTALDAGPSFTSITECLGDSGSCEIPGEEPAKDSPDHKPWFPPAPPSTSSGGSGGSGGAVRAPEEDSGLGGSPAVDSGTDSDPIEVGGSGGEEAAGGEPAVCSTYLSRAEACMDLTCGSASDGCGSTHECGECTPTEQTSGGGNFCSSGRVCTSQRLQPLMEPLPEKDSVCLDFFGPDGNYPEAFTDGQDSPLCTMIPENLVVGTLGPYISCCRPRTCQPEPNGEDGVFYGCKGIDPPAGCEWLIVRGRYTWDHDCRP